MIIKAILSWLGIFIKGKVRNLVPLRESLRLVQRFWLLGTIWVLVTFCSGQVVVPLEKEGPQKKPKIFFVDKDIEEMVEEEERNSSDDAGSEDGDSEQFHYNGSLPTYFLYINEVSWDKLHYDPYADVGVPAHLYFEGKLYAIEVEIQGSSTRKYPKKSYKLKFNQKNALNSNPFNDQGPSGHFDKIILKAMYKDSSRIREAIAFDLWRLMGESAPRTGIAALIINNEYWGVYTVVEPVDEDYLARNGYPPSGNLYKATREHGSRADFSPKRDIELAFEKKTNSDFEWDDLYDLAKVLQETPLTEEDIMEDIDPVFSLESYFKRVIWISYTQNTDARAQNFFLYNSSTHGEPFWYIIPWDSDVCLSNHWSLEQSELPLEEFLMIDGRTYLSRRFLRVDELREQYLDLFEYTLSNVFTEKEVDAIVSHYFELVEDELEKDVERWKLSASPKDEFEEIERFFSKRPSILQEELLEYRKTGKFDE